jgi:hypothetical protein
MYTTARTMNNDDKMVKMLEELQAGQKAIKADVAGLKTDVGGLKSDVGTVKDVQQKQGKQLEAIEAGVKTLNSKVDRLEDGQGHIHTALKIVASKQDVEVAVDSAKSELKADILILDSKVVKKVQSVDRRVTNIEDQAGIENPEKH